MRFFKGAAPGTHWWQNDARLMGFSGAAVAQSAAALINHIVNYSWPSPYLSLTASFAIARTYALPGASAQTPGYVYEIDTDVARVQLPLIDPVREIVLNNPPLGSTQLRTHHDGEQDLIVGIVSPAHRQLLATAPHRPGGVAQRPPVITDELWAVTWALRDSEVLLVGNAPPGCIVSRYDVF